MTTDDGRRKTQLMARERRGGGVRRPKSACSFRPRQPPLPLRPNSALGLRLWHHDGVDSIARTQSRLGADVEEAVQMRSRQPTPVVRYQRCLKLLGLVQDDSGPEDNKHSVRKVGPRVQTFLERRTVSQDDVRDAVLKEMEQSLSSHDMHQDGCRMASRNVLAKAVYEEWYFNKLSAEKLHRKQQCLEKRAEQWQQVQIKRERFEKSQEMFTKWMKQKNEQIRKDRQLRNKPKNSRVGLGIRADLSYDVWKEQKEKVYKRVMVEEKELKVRHDDERKRQQERRAEAEKAFETWKKMADEKYQMKLQAKEKKAKEDEEKARMDNDEKRRNAEAAFRCWKRNKDCEIQKKIKEIREKERAAVAARRELVINRQQMAQQAFLQWLQSSDCF